MLLVELEYSPSITTMLLFCHQSPTMHIGVAFPPGILPLTYSIATSITLGYLLLLHS